MKIVVDELFTLPRLGTDVFMKLVREAGLKYEKGRGFRATSNTDLVAVTSILEGVLGEPLTITVKCFICGGEVGCERCVYERVCDRRRFSPRCICDDCKGKGESFALYTMRFAEHPEL